MNTERCLRCGRVDYLTAWPLARRVFGFGTYAVWAMGWRACPACVAFVRAAVAELRPC